MNTLQKYFYSRQNLIDQYMKGDLTKSEYLEQNLDIVLSFNIKPFKNVDTIEKALFNYQYYNAFAKYMKSKSNDYLYSSSIKDDYLQKSNYYYSKKDKATQKVLELIDYENVCAYYIKARSKYLNGKLFEIVVGEYQMILHSTNTLILNNLKKNGVFIDEQRKSLIDGYINQEY